MVVLLHYIWSFSREKLLLFGGHFAGILSNLTFSGSFSHNNLCHFQSDCFSQPVNDEFEFIFYHFKTMSFPLLLLLMMSSVSCDDSLSVETFQHWIFLRHILLSPPFAIISCKQWDEFFLKKEILFTVTLAIGLFFLSFFLHLLLECSPSWRGTFCVGDLSLCSVG